MREIPISMKLDIGNNLIDYYFLLTFDWFMNRDAHLNKRKRNYFFPSLSYYNYHLLNSIDSDNNNNKLSS